jgi:hypothetical protein
LQELGERVALEERARDEEHREIDRIHDRGRALRPADEPGEADSERRERRGAEDECEYERDEMAREGRAERRHPDRDDAHGLDEEGDHRRRQQCGQVDRSGERSRAEPLQDSVLTPENEHDRQPGERRRDDAVAQRARQQVVGALDALELLIAVGEAEEQEEDHRQKEGEERELAAARVEPQLVPELVDEEPHCFASSVSER